MIPIDKYKKAIGDSKILVTGGAGFVGSNIVEYLLANNAKKVVVLDNLSTGFSSNIKPFMGLTNFKFVEGDITDYNTCLTCASEVDMICHQAALGSVPRSINNPMATTKTNIDGFVNVLFAAKENDIKRVVFASSSSVFGDNSDMPKVEDKIGNQMSPYAVTKYANEVFANVFSNLYNLELIGLRYFNIFGPRQSPQGAYAAAIPIFINGLLNNAEVFIDGDGNQSRDFTYVDNAVQANIRGLFTTNNAAINQIYNIACGESYTINEVFRIAKDLTKSDLVVKYRDARKGDVKHSLANISKANNLLEYQPEITFDEGIERTIAYLKTHS